MNKKSPPSPPTQPTQPDTLMFENIKIETGPTNQLSSEALMALARAAEANAQAIAEIAKSFKGGDAYGIYIAR